MLRLRHLLSPLICAVMLAAIAPVLPAHADMLTAAVAPIRQDEVANYIADIRSEDPDIEDDFSRRISQWDTPFEGTTSVYYRANELRIAVDDENTLTWSMLDEEMGDFYAEVDVIHRDGTLDNQFGFLFRFDEDNNYYLFAASSDGYFSLQLFNNGEWTPILEWEPSDTIETGEGMVNTMGVLAEGDTFTLLINDFIVGEATDDTISGTGLALNAGVFDEPPIEIAFDNFRLWHLGESTETPRRIAPVRVPDNRTPDDTPEAETTPTATATAEPTDEPTEEPTEEATPEPTTEPTEEPTEEPTPTEELTVTDPSEIVATIQTETPTYSTDFSSEPTGWIFRENASVTYDMVDGVFELTIDSPNVLTWAELPEAPTNYYIEVDATLASATESTQYGIIFNYEDSLNFYFYALHNAGYYSVQQLVNNSWEEIQAWTTSDLIETSEGNTNRIGLLMQEESYALVANGEVLAEIERRDDSSGGLALAAGTYTDPDLIMHFDNVMLWDLDEESTPGFDTATAEATEEVDPVGTPTVTDEPTEEPILDDFSEVTTRIEEIVATEPNISDDFRVDLGAWDTIAHEHGAYSYEGRALNIEAFSEERIVWSVYYESALNEQAIDFDNFYAEFDTSFVVTTGENAAGLVFRLYDTDNFYKFIVDEVGYYQMQKRVGGEYSDLISWTMSDVMDDSPGAVNRIGVLAEGTTIAVALNGTVVAQVEDADIAFGALALAVETYSTPEGHSTFDNFDLWILDE